MRNRAILIPALLVACSDNRTVAPARGDYVAPTVEPLTCVPNLDGQIVVDEARATLGVPVSFLVSPADTERVVDVKGRVDASGRLRWDWSAPQADDQVAKVTATPAQGAWYAASFPEAEHVVAFDAAGTIHGVYSVRGTDLLLHGLASAEPDPPAGRTLLVYRAPVVVLRFPLTVGLQWVSVGEVANGVLRGLPYAGRDTYENAVDAAGQLDLPDLTFSQVLRVRTHLTVEPAAGTATSTRQVSFLFECFGEVARATSKADETEADFVTAREVRRLGL